MDLKQPSQRVWIEGPIHVITAQFPGFCERCCTERDDVALCTAQSPSTFRACRECQKEYDPFLEWVAKVRAEASAANVG